MRISDWSSDVCSSDLPAQGEPVVEAITPGQRVGQVGAEIRVILVTHRKRSAQAVGEVAFQLHVLGDGMPRIVARVLRPPAGKALGAARDPGIAHVPRGDVALDDLVSLAQVLRAEAKELGRASCRERVCQYVEISVGPVSLKKK